MTGPAARPTTRRAALAAARQSRRPSRLGTPAGAAPTPDRVLAPDAGFPSLLRQVWRQALAGPDLASSLRTLLTLDGHVPADVQLRALRTADEAAILALTGLTWREDLSGAPALPAVTRPAEAAFLGELGLSVSGRVVLRVPSEGPLAARETLVDSAMRVAWSARAVVEFGAQLRRLQLLAEGEVADSRQWLAAAGPHGRDEMLEQLTESARRTAPFMLYQQERAYTNFRDLNTLTGKTLWPGHPDCALSSLRRMPLELWSDSDVLMVVCLSLLVRSGGFARIEEANGTQLTIAHVHHLLECTRRCYQAVPGGAAVPAAASGRVEEVAALADRLRLRRAEIAPRVRLYREIHGALMHKLERIAHPYAEAAERREQAVCARLRQHLPLAGRTLDELGQSLAADPGWLATPHGGFSSGLESLIYHTVTGAAEGFEADFAMSRGLRSLPRLVAALREQDWAEIARWEIADYFCCVVPTEAAARHFAGSAAEVADMAWAISSRMQYNSWHFIVGLLPRVPAVVARDHFVPPTIPDLAFFSDQHHHGHVAAKVRYSIRSPQPVTVLDRVFNGFVDVRLLRCAGQPFDEQDLLATHRVSAFVAAATGLTAKLVEGGAGVEVRSFDSHWHWRAIADRTAPAVRG